MPLLSPTLAGEMAGATIPGDSGTDQDRFWLVDEVLSDAEEEATFSLGLDSHSSYSPGGQEAPPPHTC